jgi:hypothetical protein
MAMRAKNISPEKRLKTKDNYEWFVYSERDTGLRLVCLKDLQTGCVLTTPLANSEKRIAAHKAWAGARHSRAPGTPWEIMHEMGERGVDPDKKLETTFINYGHASVGDMASIQIDLVNIPIHFGYSLFNLSSINSGQEKSSRYQKKFGEAILHDLKNYLPKSSKKLSEKYQSFGKISLELFAKHQKILTDAFTKYYKPKDKKQKKSLNSRVLDCVRFFLLIGQDTGLSFETSARDWVRIISNLKASPLIYYKKIANQLERLLTPSPQEEEKLGYKAEAPSLIKHTEACTYTNDNLKRLKNYIKKNTDLLEYVAINGGKPRLVKQKVDHIGNKYSSSEKMLAQYLLTIWPGIEKKVLLKWITKQKKETKQKLSRIIFSKHCHHNELSDLAATTELTLVMDGFYGETLRDLNRHRAWGRFGSLPLVFGLPIDKNTIDQIIAKGYGLPLYLTEVKSFSKQRKEFVKDLRGYYKKLTAFIDELSGKTYGIKDFSFAVNLLPMAHNCELWMHANPKQAFYLTHLRSRLGGHINYRDLAYKANQLIVKKYPYLKGIELKKKPNPKSKKEFFERS